MAFFGEFGYFLGGRPFDLYFDFEIDPVGHAPQR